MYPGHGREAFTTQPTLHAEFFIDERVLLDLQLPQGLVTGIIVGISTKNVVFGYIVLLDEPLIAEGYDKPWRAVVAFGGSQVQKLFKPNREGTQMISRRPAFVDRLWQELILSGFEITESRFPFTYHHDYKRSSDPERSRAQEAATLQMFGEYGEDAYWAEACLGAVAYLAQGDPAKLFTALQDKPRLNQAIIDCRKLLPAGCGSMFLRQN